MHILLLTAKQIQSRIDNFNETYDWTVFDDVPAIQQLSVVYPFYIERFSFPSRQFGCILTQEALAEFNNTCLMLEEFHRISFQWERFAKAESMIEKQVRKKSGKPFKCKERILTVKDVIEHPFIKKRPAFIFYDDDSFVSADQCQEVKNG